MIVLLTETVYYSRLYSSHYFLGCSFFFIHILYLSLGNKVFNVFCFLIFRFLHSCCSYLLVIVFNSGLRRRGVAIVWWTFCSGDITVSKSTEFLNARIWTATATNFSATSSFAPNMVSLLNTVHSETKLSVWYFSMPWAGRAVRTVERRMY